MIQSSDIAVLSKFSSSSSKYELVYLVEENIQDVLNSTILEIKKFADSYMVGKLQAFNLSVYVQLFQNGFVSQPWDFFSDSYVEINTHYALAGINGVITDFPATATRFKRNRCLGYKNVPSYMSPVQPGSLLPFMLNKYLPPAEAPYPILTDDNVIEPPLPPVKARPLPATIPRTVAVARRL